MNLVTPTSAVVMGGLAIARVGYGTWLRFVWPVLILLAILTIAAPDHLGRLSLTSTRRGAGRRMRGPPLAVPLG